MLGGADINIGPALAPGQERVIRARITIDWEKDSTWDGPGNTFTDEIEDLSMDVQADAGLPDEVTGTPSVGSTELRFTVSGRDLATGLELWRLFSPFTVGGPYRKVDLSGAALKYDVIVSHASGASTIRRFTGWVKSIDPDQKTGTVKIVAANHLHLQGKRVTLPRWARHVPHQPQLPHLDVWEIPEEDRMENAPLSFAWLWQYVLRQCGAMPGPSYRPGCVWFSSGYGGMIPEVGSWSDFQAGRSFQRQGLCAYRYPGVWNDETFWSRNVDNHPELDFHAPWLESYPYIGPLSVFDSYSQAGATTQIVPTTSPRYLNGGSWLGLKSGSASAFAKLDVYMDSWQYVLGTYNPVAEPDMASIRLTVGPSTTTLLIRSSGAGAATRTLTYATPANVATNLVYVSYEVDFSNPANSRLWFGNTLATPTGNTGTLSTYPTVHGDEGFGADKSKCRIWLRDARYLNAEVWQSSTAHTGNRIATWSNTDYGRKDFAIVNTGLTTQWSDIVGLPLTTHWIPAVTHVPNRKDVDAWELLQEMVKAANATLMIDAYGGLRIIPQIPVERYEARLGQPMPRLTADSVSGFSWRTRRDAYRDSIRYGASPARAIVDIAFEAEHAKQFMAIPPASMGVWRETSYIMPPGDDVISLEAGQLFLKVANEPKDTWGTQGFHMSILNGQPYSNTADWIDGDCIVYDLGRQDVYKITLVNKGGVGVPVYLAMATMGTEINEPGMILLGMKKITDPVSYGIVGSGSRLLDLPVSDFHSAPWTFSQTYTSLLARTSRLVPQCDDLTVPGDPRYELYDFVRLESEGLGAVAMVTGMREEFSPSSGYRHTYTVRMLSAPGDWLLGVSGVSELGISTYLS